MDVIFCYAIRINILYAALPLDPRIQVKVLAFQAVSTDTGDLMPLGLIPGEDLLWPVSVFILNL